MPGEDWNAAVTTIYTQGSNDVHQKMIDRFNNEKN